MFQKFVKETETITGRSLTPKVDHPTKRHKVAKRLQDFHYEEYTVADNSEDHPTMLKREFFEAIDTILSSLKSRFN